jgi:deazaflavin-dependent oxidoreductase (nitroreductase family)
VDVREHNRKLVEELRAAREAGEEPMPGRPMLLLTTTGARTGQPRVTPMMYVSDGDRLLVLASNAGASRHPDWYHNLVAHPEVTVEVGREVYDAVAVVTEGAERDRLFIRTAERYPFFAEHQAKITRRIPVIALERRFLKRG